MSDRPEQMRAIVLREAGALPELATVPVPRPGPGEVLVRVGACGFGLTVRHKLRRISERQLPRIPGHEIVGHVVEAGPDAGLEPGQRVIAYYYRFCGACLRCREGRQSLCLQDPGRVGEHTDGGFAEYAALQATAALALPENSLSDADLTVACDALSTPVHVANLAGVGANTHVLVLGAAGGVGIHLVLLARHLGAEVTGVDLGGVKLEAIGQAGATPVDGEDPDWPSRLENQIDVAVDFVGTEESLVAAYRTLRPGGSVFRMATYKPVSLGRLEPPIGAGERSVRGSRYCGVAELGQAVDLLVSGAVRPVVTEVRSLEGFHQLCDLIDRKTLLGRAAVVPSSMP